MFSLGGDGLGFGLVAKNYAFHESQFHNMFNKTLFVMKHAVSQWYLNNKVTFNQT